MYEVRCTMYGKPIHTIIGAKLHSEKEKISDFNV
jgi:hypothetical protein